MRTPPVEDIQVRNPDKIVVPVKFRKGRVPPGYRAGEAEEVAETILFLASDDARYTTGTELYLDGGLSLIQG